MIRLLLLLSTISFAQLKDVDSQNLAFKNFLKNSGFENGVSFWSATGGTFTSSVVSPGFGKSKGSIDFSSSGQFLRSSESSIPLGLRGKNCLAKFRYNGGGTSDIYYRVVFAGDTIAGYTATSTSYKISTAVSVWTDSLDITFPCPTTGGSLQLEFESAGDAAALSIDDTYIGENFKVGTVAQAELVGTIKISGCTGGWTSTSGSYGDYSVNTSCTYATTGKISNPSTMLPGFNLAGAPGKYWIIATGMPAYTSGATSVCAYRMTDGTDSSIEDNVGSSSVDSLSANLNFSIEKTTAFSTQFRIQTKRQTGAGTCATYGQGSADYPLTFKVYRFPSTPETVVSANVPYQGGKSTMTGATNCSWNTASGTYTAYSNDADCNSFTHTGILSDCSNAKTPCTKAVSLEAGSYLVIATGSMVADTNTNAWYQLYDGTTAATSMQLSSGTGATSRTSTLAGVFSYSSKQSNIEFNVRSLATGSANANVVNNATSLQYEMHVIPLSPSISMPNLVGSVTSNTTASERIERSSMTSICSGSPCTIASQSGSWLTSITRTGTGAYSANIVSGMFTSAPTCVCTPSQDISGAVNESCHILGITTSAVAVYTTKDATDADGAFNLICMGAR